MKPIFFVRFLLASLAAASLLPGMAQDLPAGLELPPRPVEVASHTSAASRMPGLPGGPPQVFVPISQLTLPEKPILPDPAVSPDEALTQDSSPTTESAGLPGELPMPVAGPGDSSGPLNLLPAPLEFDLEDPAAGANAPEVAAPTEGPAPDSSGVPGADLTPAPKKTTEAEAPNARGPIFRVKGADAFMLGRQRGYRFTPALGQGARDGVHTVASQVPNVLTSEVHGTRMMQLRPSPLWTTPYIENTFYMFCDESYNAVRLNPGWKIRGIQLQGPDWQWVACPRSGAGTASFSIRIRAWKTVDTPRQGTVVNLQGLTLEGPPGATDWKAAFPDLRRPAPLSVKR